MMRLALIDDYQHAALGLADWDSLKPEVAVQAFHDTPANEDVLVERLRDFDIIMAMRERTRFPRTVIERLPKLKLIVTTGVHNPAIDVKALAERGIPVCGTRGRYATTMELTWALILALARHILPERQALREGRWQTTMGVMLQNKVLGVLGLGNLGSKVAVIGKAFQMEVIAWSEHLTAERAASFGVQRVEKDELFRRSDFLTIQVLLSDRTRGLVGAPELALMKPSAYLINTSRGPIVDEQALVSALENHQIAGAGIDVYSQEPTPADNPLLRLDNALCTPHLGYVTAESMAFGYQQVLEDIRAFLNGKPIRVFGTEWTT